MSQRPTILLVLLVVMPLSLLAWLGSFLARDAAKRSEETRRLVQDPRFAAVDPLLIEDMKRHTDEFARSALLPVYLAVASGSVLVVALGWLFFRESTRAMREAQQRVTFVNQVSHELKTPLTNIQLYAEMAAGRAEKVDDQTALRYLGVVGAETSRLSRLINNVLSLARQQRDRLTVQMRRTVLDEVVSKTTEHWWALLESRGIAIDLKLAAPDGIGMLTGAIIATVAYDVGAYFVGRQFGKTPLSPSSPNKTMEGLVGGAAAAVVVSVIVLGIVGVFPWDTGSALILGLAVAIVAPVGDLCESMLKRDLGLKDMGSILPGHGGLLDRFDALLFVLPVTYYVFLLTA